MSRHSLDRRITAALVRDPNLSARALWQLVPETGAFTSDGLRERLDELRPRAMRIRSWLVKAQRPTD